MSTARDEALFRDVARHAEEAISFVEGVSATEFRKDRRLQLAIERLLEIVGEAAGGLSEEARERVPFDWRAVRGLRNVIAHQYGIVDHARLYRTARDRLPALVAAIRAAK